MGDATAMRRSAGAPVRRWLASCVAAALASAAVADDRGGALVPERLRWRELDYRARKLIFTAETSVKVELVAAAAVKGELAPAAGHGALQPAGEHLVRIELESSLLGRRTENAVLLEPGSGAALQATSREAGKRARVKTQRFTADGIAVTRRRPAEGEAGLPEARWSRASSEFLAFPAAERGEAPVTDSVALFWVLATAPLERPGDTWRLHLMSDERLLLVTIKAVSLQQRPLDLHERSAAGKRHVQRPVVALELEVDADPVGQGAAAGDLEFLGMKGSLRILLDLERRVPVEVSVRVPGAGAVVVRLHGVTLAP